jgi:hypothetical protein
MRELIPPVSPALIRAATEATGKENDHGALPVSRALGDRHPPETLLAITYRLRALANLIDGDHAKAWTLKDPRQTYTLLNGALLSAAAKAPLEVDPDEVMTHVAFDVPTFLRIVLEEAPTEGTA